MHHKLLPTVIFLGTNLMFIATAKALPDENFQPYLSTTLTNDSNIFRVQDGQEALALSGTKKMDDSIRQINAGFRLNIPISLQALVLETEASKSIYSHFDDLNHTTTSAQATWNWQVGRNWSGNIGGQHLKTLSSFYEAQSVARDMKKDANIYASVGYFPHPDWRVIGGAIQQGTDFDKRPELKKTTHSANVEVQYQNTVNTYVGVRSSATYSDLPNDENINGTLISNNYSENELSLVAYWEGSGKSHLSGRVGRTSRRHDDLSERDFSGSTGRLTYTWMMSGITTLNLSAWRETESRNNEITSFVITNGLSLSPVWSISPKVTVKAEIRRENNNYEGESTTILNNEATREDTIHFASLSLDYQLRSNIGLYFAYQQERRDSNRSSSEFQYHMLSASAHIAF